MEGSGVRKPRTHATADLSGLRVLLVHEWLYTYAGAERCLEQLMELLPHADVLAGIVTPEFRRRYPRFAGVKESLAGSVPGARRLHRWFLPAHVLAFRAHDTSAYDLVISVSHAFEKTVRARRPGAVHLCYCLTPPRYLWDLSDAHDRMAAPLQRMFLRLGRAPLRAIDRAAAGHVDRFVCLSRHVADRVRRVYGRESAVVFPPVARKPALATAPKRSDFLFTLGRLVPYKRVDLAVLAAERLGMRLLVAGDGPERTRLEQLAGPHTEFLGEIPEARAAQLLSECAAFVFCAEEDFGIAPVEANAHGAPVVAFARGGALETMRDGATAVFFHEQTVDSLVAAIQRCRSRSWNGAELRANAERFSPGNFREGMREQIRLALEHRA